MADQDGDGQMLSSSDDFQQPNIIAARLGEHVPYSPPDMPLSASGAIGANANGKRPIHTISNGSTDLDSEELAAMTGAKSRQEFPTRTHQESGYNWNRAEDEPGHSWLNKKAIDEYGRAWESAAHKEFMVKGRYGDPFEAVDNERAMQNSLKQK